MDSCATVGPPHPRQRGCSLPRRSWTTRTTTRGYPGVRLPVTRFYAVERREIELLVIYHAMLAGAALPSRDGQVLHAHHHVVHGAFSIVHANDLVCPLLADHAAGLGEDGGHPAVQQRHDFWVPEDLPGNLQFWVIKTIPCLLAALQV